MSALGLFRSRTARVVASIPPLTSKLAFPRYKTALADSATIFKHYKGRIQAVTSDPTLDDSHKHRITVRLVAELDLDTALLKAEGLAERMSKIFFSPYPITTTRKLSWTPYRRNGVRLDDEYHTSVSQSKAVSSKRPEKARWRPSWLKRNKCRNCVLAPANFAYLRLGMRSRSTNVQFELPIWSS